MQGIDLERKGVKLETLMIEMDNWGEGFLATRTKHESSGFPADYQHAELSTGRISIVLW